ncbi:hypothetical protein GCM10009827_007830 [Dactylosporangium maewongense]|uniref:DUF3500 domain-containing protein n=1 Tax=Dactylosporangium maewongense TaxID=634393 RepID=A0ABN1ZLW8_9ACTN
MQRRWTLLACALLLLTAAACGGADDTDTAGGLPASVGGSQVCVPSAVTPSAAPSATQSGAADTPAVAEVQAFLGTLTESQRTQALHDDVLDTKRCSWSSRPDGEFTGRTGLRLGDLGDAQQAAALAALRGVLSAGGYAKVLRLMDAEDGGRDGFHIALFGQPSGTQRWTLQFGGPHLAVHVTTGGGTVSVSPYFSSAPPAATTASGRADKPSARRSPSREPSPDVFALFKSLTIEQQAGARLPGTYDDVVMGPGADTGYPVRAGLPFPRLDAGQQAMVRAVIKGLVGDAAAELAQPLLDLYATQLDQTTIGYAGTADPRSENAYFRIDGPRLWLEWASTPAGGLHQHALYRDKQLDYGTGAG